MPVINLMSRLSELHKSCQSDSDLLNEATAEIITPFFFASVAVLLKQFPQSLILDERVIIASALSD